MSLINELRGRSNKVDDIRKEVIEEIKSYFDGYLESENFEKNLKKYISQEDIKKREKMLQIQFWAYHSGCSNTYFYCGGKKWTNPENEYGVSSWDYKGISLYSIHDEICSYLENRLIKKMRSLGFSFLRERDDRGRLDYFNVLYYFGW